MELVDANITTTNSYRGLLYLSGKNEQCLNQLHSTNFQERADLPGTTLKRFHSWPHPLGDNAHHTAGEQPIKKGLTLYFSQPKWATVGQEATLDTLENFTAYDLKTVEMLKAKELLGDVFWFDFSSVHGVTYHCSYEKFQEFCQQLQIALQNVGNYRTLEEQLRTMNDITAYSSIRSSNLDKTCATEENYMDCFDKNDYNKKNKFAQNTEETLKMKLLRGVTFSQLWRRKLKWSLLFVAASLIIIGGIVTAIIITTMALMSWSIKQDSKSFDNSTESILIIGGFAGPPNRGSSTNTILSFNPTENSVTNWHGGPLTKSRLRSVAGRIGEKIVVAGGIAPEDDHRNGASNTTEIYDPAVGKFVAGPEMNEPRFRAAGTVIGDHFFACGGSSNGKFSDTCEKFSFETNKWDMVAERMPAAVAGASAVSFGSHIYIFGGWTGEVRLNNVSRYDVRLKQWTTAAPMIFHRDSAKAILWKYHTTVVCGGYGPSAANSPSSLLFSCESYNNVDDKWSTMPSMAEKKTCHGLVAFDGTLFSIGGRDGDAKLALDKIEMLEENGEYSHWVTLKTRLPKARSHFATVVY